MLNQYGDVLTIRELCQILMIGRNRAYELLQSGTVKGFRIGRIWKIPKTSVIAFLSGGREQPERG